MLTYPWKCTVLHCNHLGNTWKPLVLMTQHFDYCPSASEGDNQSVRSSAPVVSRCFPGGYNVKLYISRGRLAWWLLAFLCCVCSSCQTPNRGQTIAICVCRDESLKYTELTLLFLHESLSNPVYENLQADCNHHHSNLGTRILHALQKAGCFVHIIPLETLGKNIPPNPTAPCPR